MQDVYILLFGVLAAINVLAFVWVGVDKQKSLNRSDRLPEVSFFFISIFFAALGVLLGMLVFRHKTRKIYFLLGIGLLLVQQILLVVFALEKIVVAG